MTYAANDVVLGRHLDTAEKRIKRELNKIAAGGASVAVFTGATSSTGGLSGLVPAPHAGDEMKFLRGDGTWATVSSGSSGGSIGVLDTVPSTVDGGFWYEIVDGAPVLKLHQGNYDYVFQPSDSYFSSGLTTVFLPFDSSPTEDLGSGSNTWLATSSGLSIDTTIKKIGTGSLHSTGGYIYSAQEVFDLTRDSWTFDCWVYPTTTPGVWCRLGTTGNWDVSSGVWFDANHCVIGPRGTTDEWQYRTGDIFLKTLNQWTHVALVKKGSNVYFFSDGKLVEQGVLPFDIVQGEVTTLGVSGVYLDNVRLIEGALWTEDFTPPTAADYS